MAAYAGTVTPPNTAIKEDVLTIEPFIPFSIICFATAWESKNGPVRLTLIISSHFSSGNSSIGARWIMPALLNKKSIRLNSFTTTSTKSDMLSGLAMSTWKGNTSRPDAVISDAALLSLSILRAARATLAPASANPAAIPLPMPEPEPVTKPHFPLRLN